MSVEPGVLHSVVTRRVKQTSPVAATSALACSQRPHRLHLCWTRHLPAHRLPFATRWPTVCIVAATAGRPLAAARRSTPILRGSRGRPSSRQRPGYFGRPWQLPMAAPLDVKDEDPKVSEGPFFGAAILRPRSSNNDSYSTLVDDNGDAVAIAETTLPMSTLPDSQRRQRQRLRQAWHLMSPISESRAAFSLCHADAARWHSRSHRQLPFQVVAPLWLFVFRHLHSGLPPGLSVSRARP